VLFLCCFCVVFENLKIENDIFGEKWPKNGVLCCFVLFLCCFYLKNNTAETRMDTGFAGFCVVLLFFFYTFIKK